MDIQRFANPGHTWADTELVQYEKVLRGEDVDDSYFIAPAIGVALATALCAIFGLGGILALMRDGATFGSLAMTIFPIIGLGLCGWGWKWLLSIPHGMGEIEHTYRRLLSQGHIVVVPFQLVYLWNDAVKDMPGFTAWQEYAHRRFMVLRNLVTAASHLVQPLIEECQCGKPETCGEVTHLENALHDAMVSDLGTLLKMELVTHQEAFAAYLVSRHEMRTSYNQALGAPETKAMESE